MDATVFARSRTRMYTAFTLPDGRSILNVAVSDAGGQRCASIELAEEDRRAIAGDQRIADARVDHLAIHGRRLETAIPTPSAAHPVMPLAA